jgi:PAS domain S-box-containing protein
VPGAPFVTALLFVILLFGVVLLVCLRMRTAAMKLRSRKRREEMEQVLATARDHEGRLRAAFQTTRDAVCICELDTGRIVEVNEGYCRMSGWSEPEVLGATSLELKIWPEPKRRQELFQRLRETGSISNYATDFRRRDGVVFPALLSAQVFTFSGRNYFLATSQDRSAVRHAEKVQHAIYRIAETASAPGSLEEMLAAVHRIVGEMMTATNFAIALHEGGKLHFPYFVDEIDTTMPRNVDPGRGLSAYVLRTGEALVLNDEREFEALVRSGEVEPMGAPSLSWLGVPLKTPSSSAIGVVITQSYTPGIVYTEQDKEILQFVSTQVAQAIERKRAEESLRTSERRFRALIEHGQDCILVLTRGGRVTLRSSSTLRIMGYPTDAGPSMSSTDRHVHPDDLPRFKEHWLRVLASPGEKIPFTVRARGGDGSWRSLEGHNTNLLDDPAVAGVVCNFRDVTERQQFEAQLMAADRMVSIGTMAAGVAHEINSPLAYVIANLQLIADAPVGAPILEELRAAQDGAERVRQIVRDLKTFSRADEERISAIDVNKVLDASANIAWNEIRHRARLIKEYARDVPRVAGNEARLGQVVLNLLVNAAQAMTDGGADGNEIRLRTRAAGKGLVIEVIDTGSGISPEVRARLFDPFFTTKPVGVGTGLGLYICQQIVSSMGGTIEVESEMGEGSTFRVSLPAAPEGLLSPQKQPSQPPRSKRARILAVDDEPLIGRVIKSALSAHDVTDLPSALDALERIRGGERFDLIICDLMMPHMTGMELHAALQTEAPDQARRMIFLTGGAFTQSAHEFLDSVDAPRVDKPFEVKAMRSLVDERLRLLQ